VQEDAMSEHELWNELGNLYFISGAFEQAIQAYHRSIQLDGNFGRPYGNLALAYVQQGKYEEAVLLYKRSLELLADNNEKAISWNRLGNVYRHLKDYKSAVGAYQEADELRPNSSDGREEPGQVLYGIAPVPVAGEESMPDAAGTADESDGSSPAAHVPDEAPAAQSQDPASASWTPVDPAFYDQETIQPEEITASTSWTEPDPAEAPGLYATPEQDTEVYIPDPEGDDFANWIPLPEIESVGEGEAPGAFQVEQADDLQMNPSLLFYEEADTTDLAPSPSLQGYNSEAEEFPEQAGREVIVDVENQPSVAFVVVEDGPDNPMGIQPEEAAGDPAQSEAEWLKETEAEIAKFKRVVQINPRSAFAWDALGTLYKSASLYREAIFAYQQAISIDFSKASYHHHLGLAFAAAGRDEDAITALQKVIELDPDYSLAHATLGGYYRKMGLEELAQQHIGKAMRNIYDSESEYNRACLEAICGNIDQAIELLRVALKNKQTYVEWVIHDPDLDFIRQDPRFKQLISDYTR
jgi:tetratricopeptide (TPR) repeat protein